MFVVESMSYMEKKRFFVIINDTFDIEFLHHLFHTQFPFFKQKMLLWYILHILILKYAE